MDENLVQKMVSDYNKNGCSSHIDKQNVDMMLNSEIAQIESKKRKSEVEKVRLIKLNSISDKLKRGSLMGLKRLNDGSGFRINSIDKDTRDLLFSNRYVSDEYKYISINFDYLFAFIKYNGTGIMQYYGKDFGVNLVNLLAENDIIVKESIVKKYLLYRGSEDKLVKKLLSKYEFVFTLMDSVLLPLISDKKEPINDKVSIRLLESMANRFPLNKVTLFYYDFDYIVFKIGKGYDLDLFKSLVTICLHDVGLDGVSYRLVEEDSKDLAYLLNKH